MPLTRQQIQQIFANRANASRKVVAQSEQNVAKQAKINEQRKLDSDAQKFNPLNALVAGGTALATSGGNLLASGAAALGSKRGSDKPLESVVSGGTTGLTQGATTIAELGKPENADKLAALAKSAGAPKEATSALEAYAKSQNTKVAAKNKLKAANDKVITDRETTRLAEEQKAANAQKLAEKKANYQKEADERKKKIEEIKAATEAKKKSDDAIEKALIAARKDAVKSYEEQVKEGTMEDTPEKFREYLNDNIQAVVYGKVPEYKTTVKKRTEKDTKGMLWWKEEIDKVVEDEVTARTGKYIEAREKQKDKYVVGKIYKDANGVRARYKGNGEWEVL